MTHRRLTKLLIVHCDDIGMSREANAAAKELLIRGSATSGSVMMPCPWAYEFMTWFKEHSQLDIGIHITLTSEWQSYRWRPLTQSPSLVDESGFMYRTTQKTALNASSADVARETLKQIKQAFDWGAAPTHIDTHMGASLARLDLAKVYIDAAQEYAISPMVVDPDPKLQAELLNQGYDPNLLDLMQSVSTPKITALYGAAEGRTYAEKKKLIYKQLENLESGLTYFIIHPALESDSMRIITDSWQQRAWEYRIFMEPETKDKIEELGIRLTNWRELAGTPPEI